MRLLLILLLTSATSVYSQCNVTWTAVSGANQTISVDSRLVTGTSLTGTLTINPGVTLCTEGTASIAVTQLTNNGSIIHNGTGVFTASNVVINNGSITTTNVGFSKFNSAYSFTNSNNSFFTCAGPISISATSFTNGTNAMFSNTGALNNITIGCNIDNSGDLLTDGDFIKTNSANYLKCFNGGNIVSQTNIDIEASPLNIDNGGSIVANNNITLNSIVINAGLIESQTGYIDVSNSSNPLTNLSTGAIKSFGNLNIEAEITNSGLIEITNSGIFDKTNSSRPITNNLGAEIIIRGANSNFIARGNMTNRGRIICEGDMNRGLSTTSSLLNESSGYVRVCNDYTKRANLTNDGIISVGHNFYFNASATVIIRNNSGAKINVVNNLDFVCHLQNIGGQIIVGDSLSHRNHSSSLITISDSGIVFCTNYIHNNGGLIGGGTPSTIGFLKINGISQTLNTVNLSGYIDICDAGHNGVAPYFDSESPVYSYPTVNITDGTPLPSFAESSFTDTCTSIAIVLPVELLFFNATLNNKIVTSEWTTVSEINNDFFSVQRSKDAINFEEIGTVAGAGNNSSTLNYAFDDENPFEGTSYYRLKQVDFDGSFSYSSIESVTRNPFNILNIYPNPAEGFINILVETPEDIAIEIAVFNNLGQEVIIQNKNIIKGQHVINLNTSNLSSGSYIFKITIPSGIHIEKDFIKK